MTRQIRSNFQIRVPASIANLGCGFDTLAVALQLYLTLKVDAATDRDHGVRFRFIDCELKGENKIATAFNLLADRKSIDIPALDVEVRSQIPMGAGLGSSAAATVAGLHLGNEIGASIDANEILQLAAELEGHPDNVAAAILGGLTSSYELDEGHFAAVQFRWPSSIKFLVLTPDFGLSTASSRQVLPTCVSRKDAVHNLQRIVLLISSLQNHDFSLLREGMRDRIHQPYREQVVPGLHRMLQVEHEDLLGVCLSGAGPSVVGLAERKIDEVSSCLREAYCATGLDFCLRVLEAHPSSTP